MSAMYYSYSISMYFKTKMSKDIITRPVIIFLLITGGLLAKKGGLLTKKYLIEVANKEGNEEVD